ncbi:MAG: L-seryl-tRNA(Sec) selenium transferase, partial [Dehalococcoidales bacterium]|nr:L-seryl-tRNA(Sec) selenium transferase [Dehalococcoidales bacterium]
METAANNIELRKLPSVEKLLAAAELQPQIARYSRALVTCAAQEVLAEARYQIVEGAGCPSPDEFFSRIKESLNMQFPAFLSPVINGTGIIIHTNLGRAPLSHASLEALAQIGGNFCPLEYDMPEGKRGVRAQEAEKLLCALTGAQSALVVNNNAAAVLLVLIVLAHNKEVVISRGELVQIGGGFRVPEIMQQSGVSLREVGTTNQTYLKDYEAALNDNTGLLLKVHRS